MAAYRCDGGVDVCVRCESQELLAALHMKRLLEGATGAAFLDKLRRYTPEQILELVEIGEQRPELIDFCRALQTNVGPLSEVSQILKSHPPEEIVRLVRAKEQTREKRKQYVEQNKEKIKGQNAEKMRRYRAKIRAKAATTDP